MCTSSAIARMITSGGSMLVRTLYVNPIATNRPIVQTTLTSTATIIRPVIRHERNIRRCAAIVSSQNRRRQVPGVGERDAVVGLADLEAAVVERLHAGRQPGIDQRVDLLDARRPRTSSMRSSSKVTTMAVTVPSSDTRSPRSSGSSSTVGRALLRPRPGRSTSSRGAAALRCRHRRLGDRPAGCGRCWPSPGSARARRVRRARCRR